MEHFCLQELYTRAQSHLDRRRQVVLKAARKAADSKADQRPSRLQKNSRGRPRRRRPLHKPDEEEDGDQNEEQGADQDKAQGIEQDKDEGGDQDERQSIKQAVLQRYGQDKTEDVEQRDAEGGEQERA